jgi:hypothetical protein
VNVVEIFDVAAARSPAGAALIWGAPGREHVTSLGALADRSRRIAALFRSRDQRLQRRQRSR